MGAWVRWGHSIKKNMILNSCTCVSHESRESTPRFTGRYDHHDPAKQHAENHAQASNSRIHITDAMRGFSVKASRGRFSRGWFNGAQKASRLRAQCFCPLLFGTVPASCKRGFVSRSSKEGGGGNSAPSTSNAVTRGPHFNFKKRQAIEIKKHRF